ncbi:hypothetical protein MMC18_005376 [Xylographa bjoerkii]|nr:hypothetical protein [Xylographa bjoerkii]
MRPPPQQDNLPLSIAHHLLLVAIRRKALESVDNLEGLFAGTQNEICFKQEWRQMPVLLVGGWVGLSIKSYDEPATTGSMTEYIASRGKHLRYETTISFYALRKRAATDLANAFGADEARALMGHHPDSRVLEKHYWDLTSTSNISAATLGEDCQMRVREMKLDGLRLVFDRIRSGCLEFDSRIC